VSDPFDFTPSLTSREEKKIETVLQDISLPPDPLPTRLSLAEPSDQEVLDLAAQSHELLGKAAGYIPDFLSITENMKSAYMKVVRNIWVAAQKKARSYDE